MERREEVDRWMENSWTGADHCAEGEEARLHRAFRAVLCAMPDEDFDRFDAANPTVICQPHVNASVLSYYVSVPTGVQGGRVNVIYFSPSLFRKTDKNLTNVVAHECAHVVLGHHENPATDSPRAREQEADDRSASWGFRRTYTKSKFDQLP